MTDLVEGMFILMCSIHGMGVLVEGFTVIPGSLRHPGHLFVIPGLTGDLLGCPIRSGMTMNGGQDRKGGRVKKKE